MHVYVVAASPNPDVTMCAPVSEFFVQLRVAASVGVGPTNRVARCYERAGRTIVPRPPLPCLAVPA